VACFALQRPKDQDDPCLTCGSTTAQSSTAVVLSLRPFSCTVYNLPVLQASINRLDNANTTGTLSIVPAMAHENMPDAAFRDGLRQTDKLFQSKIEDVLRRRKSRLTKREDENFSQTTLIQVKQTILRIQDQQGREKKLLNLTRIEKFLDAMSQWSQVTSTFADITCLAGYIWGPVRALLEVIPSRCVRGELPTLSLNRQRARSILLSIPYSAHTIALVNACRKHCPRLCNSKHSLSGPAPH
jgi:hypothetical protein